MLKRRAFSNLSFAGADENFWYWNLNRMPVGSGFSSNWTRNCRVLVSRLPKFPIELGRVKVSEAVTRAIGASWSGVDALIIYEISYVILLYCTRNALYVSLSLTIWISGAHVSALSSFEVTVALVLPYSALAAWGAAFSVDLADSAWDEVVWLDETGVASAACYVV